MISFDEKVGEIAWRSDVEVIPAYGGPSFELDGNGEYLMSGMTISGPTAWRLLAETNIPKQEIGTLSVHVGGMTDEVKAELDESGVRDSDGRHSLTRQLYGATTGATYRSSDRHVEILAGNLQSLGLPRRLFAGETLAHSIDKALRLAFGHFVFDVLHPGIVAKGERDIMVNKYSADDRLLGVIPPEILRARNAYFEDTYPAFMTSGILSLGFMAWTVASNVRGVTRYHRAVAERMSDVDIAATAFELHTDDKPIVTMS